MRSFPGGDGGTGYDFGVNICGWGEIVSSWRRTGDQIAYTCTVPTGIRAKVMLPGVSEQVSGATKSWRVLHLRNP